MRSDLTRILRILIVLSIVLVMEIASNSTRRSNVSAAAGVPRGVCGTVPRLADPRAAAAVGPGTSAGH